MQSRDDTGARSSTPTHQSSANGIDGRFTRATATLTQARMLPFAALVVELAVLNTLIYAFRIESPSFRTMMLLACGGFLIHHWLPLRWRLPFFVALSVSGLPLIVGVQAGLWLLGLGLVLIGLCHVPVPFIVRVLMLLGVAGGLAAMRTKLKPDSMPEMIWPLLGSMFMFRLVVYLYDLKHRAAPVGFWRALAYFFMLPNICFPLFPVVDYKLFCRNYFDREELEIYQSGIRWILRGTIHLLLYRFIDKFFYVPGPDVVNLGDVFRFMVGSYLLYLRISGLFHIVVGTLHLFGFNLPEVNHRYLLASNFTNFWRRINIYWKDFIMKVVFYPVLFRLKPLGQTRSLVLATIVSFVMTWLLHSYQWFWLRNSFPITFQDIVFWAILGSVVIVNVLSESRSRQIRMTARTSEGIGASLMLAAQTIGTFLVISALWSFWITPSADQWLAVMSQARNMSAIDLLLIVVVLGMLGLAVIFTGRKRRDFSVGTIESKAIHQGAFWRSAVTVTLASAALIGLSRPEIHSLFHPTPASMLRSLRRGGLNPWEARLLHKGYYEKLINITPVEAAFKENRNFNGPIRPREDYMVYGLAESVSVVFGEAVMTTNRWGMRDREYEKIKPPNTYRIALLGASRSMGWGVADSETYENIVEDRLNEHRHNGKRRRYEILNFSVNGYGPVQKRMALNHRALEFEPDAVFYVSHAAELDWIVARLAAAVRADRPIPYDRLRQIVRSADLHKGTRQELMTAKLAPYASELLQWVYGGVVSDCRDKGIVPCWVYVPNNIKATSHGTREELFNRARRAGFVIIDLSSAYDGASIESLQLSDTDGHPSVFAHSLLADTLHAGIEGSLILKTAAVTDVGNEHGHAKQQE